MKTKLNFPKTQKGFGIFGILLILGVLGVISAAAYGVYKSSQPSHSERTAKSNNDKLPAESGSDDEYKFNPKKIDTSRWPEFEPFQGFTLKYPPNWNITHSSDGFIRQLTNGKISEDGKFQAEYGDPHMTTFLESPETRRNDLQIIIEGAEIKIYMTMWENSQKDRKNPCSSVYKDRQSELIEVKDFIICQMKVSKYGYDFTVNSTRMNYRLSVVYSPDYSDDIKDTFNSLALATVKSFNLY